MDAQITRGSCDEDIAQLLWFATQECLHVILLQEGIDAGVVVVDNLVIGIGVRVLFARHELCQQTWGGMGEYIAVSHVVASLVSFDYYLCYHERRSAEFEEIVGGTDFIH